jgi:hypothetical protein
LSPFDLRQQARALWLVSWPFLAVVTVLLGIAVIVEPATLARRATTVAAVGVLIAILHGISRAGRPVLASWILVLGLSVVVTQRAWITGGIHAPVAVFYVLFIVMAGALIGARGGLATAAVCLAGAVVLTAGTALAWLTPRPGAGSTLGGFVFVVLAIGLALVLQALVTRRPHGAGVGLGTVQMLVHDMRSPLQVLLAHLDLLREDVRGQGVSHVEGALTGAATLRRLTNSFLDVSRLEAGRMPVQRSLTDLSALAASVVEAVRVLQPGRDIVVDTCGDPTCTCDPELTRRIIENLVTNAMKHTPLEGQVRLLITGFPRGVSLGVHDDGPGVAPERRAGIFDPYIADAPLGAAGYESSGLGLAFCKLAVEAQGGTIRIETGAPRGSVFIVDLPR